MLRWRLDTGRLYRVQPLVYSLTPTVLPRGRMLAAALTFGPGAVLSHRAAAAVWDLGRRGAKKIRAVLAELTAPEPTKEGLEQAFRALCKKAAIPLPSFNVSLCGHEVDAYWPQYGLVVELDGWEWHRTRKSFEEDRRRAAVLEAAGYRLLRFTWRQVIDEPELVAAAIRSGCPREAGRARAPARAAARPPSGP